MHYVLAEPILNIVGMGTQSRAALSRQNQRLQLKDSSGWMRKRNVLKILRCRQQGEGDDQGYHWRQILTFFVPCKDNPIEQRNCTTKSRRIHGHHKI